MHKSFLSSITAVVLVLSASTAHAKGELLIYHWFDYIPQKLVDEFSQENDIKVIIDTFDSNESMLAALKAGKLGSYDVAVPGDYMVKILGNEGMLDTFDSARLSNFGNIPAKWIDVEFDQGRKSSVPYQWGSTSFSVNRDMYKGDINTLAILFDPPAELKGKINVLDSQGDVLTMASMYLGIPQCTADRGQLKKLNDLVQSAKVNWASFGSDTAKDVLVSGDAAVGMIYNGFSVKAREENPNIEYAYPQEGYIITMENIVLLKDAPNRENALIFMNFMLEPEHAAAVSNYAKYASAVSGAENFYDASLKNLPEATPPADQIGQFVQVCTQEVQAVYDTIWTNLKK